MGLQTHSFCSEAFVIFQLNSKHIFYISHDFASMSHKNTTHPSARLCSFHASWVKFLALWLPSRIRKVICDLVSLGRSNLTQTSFSP